MVNVCPVIFVYTYVWFLNLWQMLCHCIIQANVMPWQMLLPYDIMVDVITTEEDVTSSI